MLNKIKNDYLKSGKLKRVLVISCIYRIGSHIKNSKMNYVSKKAILAILLIFRRLLIEYPLHVELPFSTKIGESLRIVHPYNILINPNAKIGNNCTIFHEVTIGTNEFSNQVRIAPIIGNNVYIGCGAKIIGPITIGDNVRIGANSVVTTNIPSNCTVVGHNRIIFHKENINL